MRTLINRIKMKTTDKYPLFSFFKYPITNLIPWKPVSIRDVYRGLVCGYYADAIAQIRNETSEKSKRRLKTKSLDFVTFAGQFRSRKSEDLIQRSGYTCIDFDHIEAGNIEAIKNRLLNDTTLETELLFLSPGGEGLKWIIELDDLEHIDYETYYKGVVGYLRQELQIDNYVDTTGKDIARACFMSYDPDAYINPKYK